MAARARECERAPARAGVHARGRCPRAPLPGSRGGEQARSAGSHFLPAGPMRGPRRPLWVTFTLTGEAGSGGSRWRGGTLAVTCARVLLIPSRGAALGRTPACRRATALPLGCEAWGLEKRTLTYPSRAVGRLPR